MRNWYVITGGPSAGKTTIIEALAKKGFHVEPESARIVIDEGIAEGKTIEEIRSDEGAFQDKVYRHKKEREKNLNPEELIFFDRGMHDTSAYNKLFGIPISKSMRADIDASQYKTTFLLHPFKYEEDYARTETIEERNQLFDLLKEAYEHSGIPVVAIDSFPSKEERVAYFFEYLLNNEGVTFPN